MRDHYKWLDIKVGEVYEYDASGTIKLSHPSGRLMVRITEIIDIPYGKMCRFEVVEGEYVSLSGNGDTLCHINHIQTDSRVLKRKYEYLYNINKDSSRIILDEYIIVGVAEDARLICLNRDGHIRRVSYAYHPNYSKFNITLGEVNR